MGSRLLGRARPLVAAALAVASLTLVPGTGADAASGRAARPGDSIWSAVPSPSPGRGVFNAFLTSASAVSPDDAWAVGIRTTESAKDQTLALHWDGSAWSAVPSPNRSGKNNDLNGVAAIATDDVWAVGQVALRNNTEARTLALHWDGTSWSPVPTPNPATAFGSYNTLLSVSAIASDDVWAAGWSSNPDLNTIQMLFEHWDGHRWSLAQSPTPLGSFQFANGVFAIASDDVWAVGDDQTHSPSASLSAHWDGQKWTIVPTPRFGGGEEALHAVVASGPDDVWAVGDDLPGGSVVGASPVAMHWTGSGWKLASVPSPGPGGARLFGAAVLGSGDVWAVGEQADRRTGEQFTFTEQWNGSAWSIVDSPNVGHQNTLLGPTAIAPSTVWAVGAHEPTTGCCLRTLVLQTDQG
ncbi:MAG TPA: hypothetical protein VGH10_13090 [Actinomycetota bacterium]